MFQASFKEALIGFLKRFQGFSSEIDECFEGDLWVFKEFQGFQEEKEFQIKTLEHLHKAHDTDELLRELQHKAINNKNIFEALMEVCKVCSLGQITSALFEVGGQYRRNM